MAQYGLRSSWMFHCAVFSGQWIVFRWVLECGWGMQSALCLSPGTAGGIGSDGHLNPVHVNGVEHTVGLLCSDFLSICGYVR
jgi:hypothetical protein